VSEAEASRPGGATESPRIPPAQRGSIAQATAQEQFQRAYISAVVATAGCNQSKPDPDVDGIDLHIRQNLNGDIPFCSALDLQLKTTTQSSAVDDLYVSLRLTKPHYNALRTPNVTVPRLLVVMTLPGNVEDWQDQSEEQLRLYRCSYWLSLKGAPAINGGSVTVKIPRQNMFGVESLWELMYRVRAGLDLGS
jgi:hypothetical protein